MAAPSGPPSPGTFESSSIAVNGIARTRGEGDIPNLKLQYEYESAAELPATTSPISELPCPRTRQTYRLPSIDTLGDSSFRISSRFLTLESSIRAWQKSTLRAMTHMPRSFDLHILTGCDRVSKLGKEKWQALVDTFTPLVQIKAESQDLPLLSETQQADETGEERRFGLQAAPIARAWGTKFGPQRLEGSLDRFRLPRSPFERQIRTRVLVNLT
ncbi:hypothetical protein B0T26DRAFT_1143 [Lasiosphaeria miniovina]|uniref:Uncharacterized protein n=1 Tax=Lasiosphaeria miniovina TaxID=1954250 RepID=A0AA40BES4_9PEZI|nr:uncharacterized protein B0T26DRAFT_1143 [Lasiosphaeria miniovina]KAK0732931.1 hypothetical protein B0T26DRAFT_1143 [Lasiosphaeria miniovina]